MRLGFPESCRGLLHRPMARAVLVSRAAATPTADRRRRLPMCLQAIRPAVRRSSRWVLETFGSYVL